MKQVESLDRYVIVPNVNFYGGFKYDGEDIFLCDDCESDDNYSFKVTQRIENGTLITDLERTYTRKNGKAVREKSHQEIEIEAGQLLVYVQGTGYTISEYRMCLVDEAIEHYKLLKGGE
jgi:hypothetical protein